MAQTHEELLAKIKERARKRKAEGVCKDCGGSAEPKGDGISDFTISEAVKINEIIFDNKYEIGFLLKRDYVEKAG